MKILMRPRKFDRVLLGGSWYDGDGNRALADRNGTIPADGNRDVGVRVLASARMRNADESNDVGLRVFTR